MAFLEFQRVIKYRDHAGHVDVEWNERTNWLLITAFTFLIRNGNRVSFGGSGSHATSFDGHFLSNDYGVRAEISCLLQHRMSTTEVLEAIVTMQRFLVIRALVKILRILLKPINKCTKFSCLLASANFLKRIDDVYLANSLFLFCIAIKWRTTKCKYISKVFNDWYLLSGETLPWRYQFWLHIIGFFNACSTLLTYIFVHRRQKRFILNKTICVSIFPINFSISRPVIKQILWKPYSATHAARMW